MRKMAVEEVCAGVAYLSYPAIFRGCKLARNYQRRCRLSHKLPHSWPPNPATDSKQCVRVTQFGDDTQLFLVLSESRGALHDAAQYATGATEALQSRTEAKHLILTSAMWHPTCSEHQHQTKSGAIRQRTSPSLRFHASTTTLQI